MPFEPNKENFMARLKDSNFAVADLLEEPDVLREVLWYLDSARTKEIVDTLLDAQQTSGTEATHFIKNIAKLYPLSKSLVMSIMSDFRRIILEDGTSVYRDITFLGGLDEAYETKKAICDTFNEITARGLRLTTIVANYLDDLDNLYVERDNLDNLVEKLKSSRDKRDKLQEKINKMRADNDEEKLRQEIEQLEAELNLRQSEKARLDGEIAAKQCRIDAIRQEISELEQTNASDEELRKIQDLFKQFPKDAED